ncbi:MAG: hypothetical protein JNM21_14720 [Taibaiella sp.]|nr:hypothetical protein [Taibaiella sp.]
MLKPFILLLISLLSIDPFEIKACTIFSCFRNGEVFVAANEDDNTPFTRIWYNPSTDERYGSICFGGPDMQVAAAMNEHGLFFDFAAASYDISKLKLDNPFQGFLMWEVLGKCKNVAEARAILNKYDYNSASQVLLADKEGNSILVNPKGIVEKEGDFQVNANCNMINGTLSCRRPEIVNEALLYSKENSVEFLKGILDKTHQEGAKLTTLYSTICDLKRGIIYVYLYHDYTTAYKIDVKAELKKGYRIENLADHFQPSFAYEEFSRNHNLYLKESIINEMTKNGVDATVDKYLLDRKNMSTVNPKLDEALLEVGLQLIKDSWNKYSHGGMWDYWFSIPKGYEIQIVQDLRLGAAKRLLNALIQEQPTNPKLNNFILEMLGYTNLIDGHPIIAEQYYLKAIANPELAYPVTMNRGKEMLSRMKK